MSTVRFENASDGWLFNPGLWATTDGGAQWHRVSLPGEVIAVAAADGMVFAAAEPVAAASGQARLYQSQVGTTKWARVAGVAPAAALTVSGHSVWSASPRPCQRPPTAASTGPSCRSAARPMPRTPPQAPAASPANVALDCTNPSDPQPGSSPKDVFTSANGGRTFHLAGHPGDPGNVGLIAMPPGNPQVITLTASSGASYLYRSADSGKTWQMATYFDGGLGFRYLAYVSATTGYLIHYSASPAIAYGKGLMTTTNAGTTWKTIPIP